MPAVLKAYKINNKIILVNHQNQYLQLNKHCIKQEISLNKSFNLFKFYDNTRERYFGEKDILQKKCSSAIRIHSKKLILKGLGYRAQLLPTNILSFRCGFSHSVEVKVPQYISVKIVQSKIKSKAFRITFESKDLILLGQFVNKVYQFSPYGAHTGKGFSYLRSKKLLKHDNTK